MCVTSLGKVLAIQGNRAVVEIGGRREEVRIDLVTVSVGDLVYCASGLAVERADA